MKDICFHRKLSLIIMNALMGFAEEFWCGICWLIFDQTFPKPSRKTNREETGTPIKDENSSIPFGNLLHLKCDHVNHVILIYRLNHSWQLESSEATLLSIEDAFNSALKGVQSAETAQQCLAGTAQHRLTERCAALRGSVAVQRAALQEAAQRSRAALQEAEKAMMEVANLSEESLKEALEVWIFDTFIWGCGRFWWFWGIFLGGKVMRFAWFICM